MRSNLIVLGVVQLFSFICSLNFDPTKHPHWHLLNLTNICGISHTDRIIGGQDASLGQYPWIARIAVSGVGDNMRDMFLCGGVIISPMYILTAAHCVPPLKTVKINKVRLGEHDAETDRDCIDNNHCAPAVQDIKVAEVIPHKKYGTPFKYKNDICLLRLEKPIQFSEFVAPICVPYGRLMNDSHAGQMMDVAGWGITDMETMATGIILQTLKVPVWNQTDCKDAFDGLAEIGEEQLCAGGVIGQDSCSGDSGGPLMRVFSLNGPPKYFITGVVSFGTKNCAKTNKPGVYTRVAYFLDWILDNIY